MSSEAMLTAAREMTARGWVVHPQSKPDNPGDSPGKRPLLTDWQTLTKTPQDIDKYINKGCNIGLVCGKASDVDAFDFDIPLFQDELLDGVEVNTLISGHRTGRGHILFQHEDDMFSEKHHFIGIEYFGNNEKGAGSNLVLPPSIHNSGEVYKWKDATAPLSKMSGRLKENWKRLAKRENDLHDYFKKCRRCFTTGSKKYDKEDARSKGLWDRPDDIAVHGMEGRRAILAIVGELKAVGCPDDLLHMACKRFFGKDYDYEQTADAFKHIEPIHPKCETLRQYLNVECDGCSWRSSIKNDTPDEDLPEISFDDIMKLRKKTDSRKLTLELPNNHFISNFRTWISSTTDAYPDYSTVCALSLLSTASKGRAYLRLKQERIKCNIWAFLLGNSTTSRKSTVVNKTQAILNAAFTINNGPESYSYEGYVEYLSTHPIAFFARDEVGGLLCEYEKKYMQGIVDVECSLYDGKGFSRTLARGRAKEPKEYKISDPYIVKLYATTPDSFARYTKLEDLTSGWLFRFLFVSPEYSKPFMPLDIESSENITAWGNVLTHLKRVHSIIEMKGDIDFKIEPAALTFIQTAQQRLEESAVSNGDHIYGAAIGRAIPYAFKIAMLLELGKHEPNFEISLQSMKQSFELVVEYFIPTLLDIAQRLEEDIRRNDICKVLYHLKRKNGIATHSALLHDTKMISRVFKECIETMIESGTVEIIRQKDSKVTWYKLNTQNSPIPKILSVLCFSDITPNAENLENSDKQIKKDDIIDDTRAYVMTPTITTTVREAENVENSEKRENCGICSNPLNGNSEQGPAGLGRIHPACKFNPVKIKALANVPIFAGTDNQHYSLVIGDIKDLPWTNAHSLIKRKVAEEVKP